MTIGANSRPALDWPSLRARFKQRQVETKNVYQNWQIRVHRALSWMRRANELPEDLPDAKLLLLWISLNALYGRWDSLRNAPGHDSEARDKFVERACGWSPEVVGLMLRYRRSLVKKLMENFYISSAFWRSPLDQASKSAGSADARFLEQNLHRQDYCRVLCQALDRVYVLRGQIAHGAATANSRLNRKTLLQSLELLSEVVPTLISLTIEHGANNDWPEMCYPPIG